MKEAFNKISFKSSCIFPNENQPWEMALIKNYLLSSHKNIIGYQHSTTRFWRFQRHIMTRNNIMINLNLVILNLIH